MRWRRTHLSDAELLLLVEDELSPRRTSSGRRHLAACASCAARSRRLAGTLDAVGRLHRTSREEPPLAAVVRARLRLALRQTPRPAFWRHAVGIGVADGRWTGAVVAVVLLLSVIGWIGTRSDPLAPEVGPILPRAELTPGATRPISTPEVCGEVAFQTVPRVAPSVPRQIFDAYGADYRRADDYELDFLITPELGGTTAVENLWPQPFVSTPWNAHVKDELERLFQREVCEGRLDIEAAQRQMATDWIAAYKRHFDTDHPLRDYATRPVGPDDLDARLSEAAERRLLPIDASFHQPGGAG